MERILILPPKMYEFCYWPTRQRIIGTVLSDVTHFKLQLSLLGLKKKQIELYTDSSNLRPKKYIQYKLRGKQYRPVHINNFRSGGYVQ